jgi:alpha-galactosidase
MIANPGTEISAVASEISLPYIDHEIPLNAAGPSSQWHKAATLTFCRDWQAKNADPALTTRVQVMWSAKTLYVRFECRYRELFLFEDSQGGGRRDRLWERDVAEVFLQPDPARPQYYKEFEVSPNGLWIDLDIFPDGQADLTSGMQCSVSLDHKQRVWVAELAIPLRAVAPNFDPTSCWGVNFFRIEGADPRTYHAWQPTLTPHPDFHVPEVFGRLRFVRAPE